MTFADGAAVVELLAGFARKRVAEVEVSHRERPFGGASQYYRPLRVVEGHRNLLRLRKRLGSPPIRWRARFRAPFRDCPDGTVRAAARLYRRPPTTPAP